MICRAGNFRFVVSFFWSIVTILLSDISFFQENQFSNSLRSHLTCEVLPSAPVVPDFFSDYLTYRTSVMPCPKRLVRVGSP